MAMNNLTAYTVTPEGGVGELLYLLEDAHIWKDSLPPFMGKIEPGIFSVHDDGGQWTTPTAKRPNALNDGDGQLIMDRPTGKPRLDFPFLPDRVPFKVQGWRLEYWERKSRELGLKLMEEDVIGRMDFRPLSAAELKRLRNDLSMRQQRYRLAVGYLAPLKDKKGVSKQNLDTVADLTIMQGVLNTVWLPNHMLHRGPWKVIQPKHRPGYKHSNLDRTNYQGSSFVVEHAYGLSKRMLDISDTLIYIDCRLIEMGKPVDDETRRTHMENWKLKVWKFEYWRRLHEHGPSISDIKQALDYADGINDGGFIRQRIRSGDFSSFWTPPAPSAQPPQALAEGALKVQKTDMDDEW